MGIILSNAHPINILKLQTSKGNDIDNYQVFELSDFEKNQFQDYTPDKFMFAIYRNNPSPIYNCHGMSFASKRTNIDKSEVIRLILDDDGYKEIEINKVLPGDLILYIKQETGDIAHSGMVVNAEHATNNISNITVLSKWGKYKEVIHNMNNCPYTECSKQFYRLTHEEY